MLVTMQVVTLILQRQDRKFPEYIAHFLRLFAKYALLDLDPKSMHVIRPKWRLLSLAFLVRAASDATFSNPGWINSRAEGAQNSPAKIVVTCDGALSISRSPNCN